VRVSVADLACFDLPCRRGHRNIVKKNDTTMGWFDGGGSSDSTSSSSEAAYGDSSSSFSPGSYSGGGGGGSSGLSEFQEFSLQLQQQMVIQQVMTELAQKAFDKCCPSSSRDSQLSSKEASCIAATTHKWLDANEFIVGRLGRKQQQANSRS
jgi:Tim10/DDP family zinc finger